MKPLSLYQNLPALRRLPSRILLAVLGVLLALPGLRAETGTVVADTEPATPGAIDWLEPRGVNVVDLVGLVPEEHLMDTIVRGLPGVGLALYDGGERVGDTVRLRLRYSPSATDTVLCPGKPASFDEWPSAAPAGTMRVYAGGQEITAQVLGSYSYFPAGQSQPSANTGAQYRYPASQASTVFAGDGAVQVPANLGCEFRLDQEYADVTAEFAFTLPARIAVTVLGSASGTFRSYIGPGFAGQLDSLRNQMQARYQNRDDDIDVSLPAGTEFVLVKFPPTPVDPYVDPNMPGSGTYRIRRSNGKLSVDHTNTMALPFYGQWQDADQSGGAEYLPSFTDGVRVSSPEYFVPVGFSYDPCMTNGGCPASLLDGIYNATMTMEIFFYKIDRIQNGLTQIPLRQVGPSWSPGAVAAGVAPAAGAADFAPRWNAPLADETMLYLPAILYAEPIAPDAPANCPCGWFDSDGRMLDYVGGL